MEKHKYDSCEVIVIFSCFILSRLGVGVETKTTKDQVWQVDFSTTALLFTVSILLEKNKNDTGTADSFFQERNISFSTSLVILCLPLTEHHCLCIFLFLRWTTLCSFRCTSTHIHLKLNYFGHLSYFYRWLTRGTCSVQQPWQSCIWGSSCAAKWTSQAPTRSLLIHLLFIHFIFDQQAGRLI